MVIEAWDAKYGKPYLRDELEELSEKLSDHPQTTLVGFIVDDQPDLREGIIRRMKEISDLHGVELHIFSFAEWIDWVCDLTELDKDILAQEWLVAFVESLAQKRRHYAPIDEPTFDWVKNLAGILKEVNNKE